MSNQIGRYVWLVSLLRNYGKLTFEQIQRKWDESGLNAGEQLTRRTFHNHRNAIADIFDVDIECDIHGGYQYYIANIDNLESDSLRSWLIDSYSVLNQVRADRRLEGRIIFEKVPSASNWLTTITSAIRNGHVLFVTHQGYGKTQEHSFELEPYYLKVAKRRWYLLARSPYYSERNRRKNREDGRQRPEDVFMVYALDRIHFCQETDKTFEMNQNFDINKFFEGCCGIIPSREKIRNVIFRSTHRGADYLRSLPLHDSQQELSHLNDEDWIYFQLQVKPTFDLYQAFLSQGDQLEVLQPDDIREEMKNFARVLASYYLDTED